MGYKLFKSKIEIEGVCHTTYGIESSDAIVEDISTNLATVNQLIELLNDSDVSQEHLFDIVQDFLAYTNEIEHAMDVSIKKL